MPVELQGEEQRVTAVDIFPDLTERYGLRTTDGGPTLVPKGRYLDEAYAELERRLLWPRIWQLACLTTDLPDPGDWIEYRIADQSYAVLRDLEGTVRAFHNVCPHRGFQLCEGSGSCDDGLLRCGFHGWRFDLTGPVREVSSRPASGASHEATTGCVRSGSASGISWSSSTRSRTDRASTSSLTRSRAIWRPSSSRSASARHGSPSPCREIGK